jgi:hypothetical protein
LHQPYHINCETYLAEQPEQDDKNGSLKDEFGFPTNKRIPD